ncbi:unnamed protein product [Somion occarium]|uniref:Uncharacterized protein n=1 Tax=Somion occarium TaxID=3059160 RepID=A0ABP1CUV3_9APHY
MGLYSSIPPTDKSIAAASVLSVLLISPHCSPQCRTWVPSLCLQVDGLLVIPCFLHCFVFAILGASGELLRRLYVTLTLDSIRVLVVRPVVVNPFLAQGPGSDRMLRVNNARRRIVKLSSILEYRQLTPIASGAARLQKRLSSLFVLVVSCQRQCTGHSPTGPFPPMD